MGSGGGDECIFFPPSFFFLIPPTIQWHSREKWSDGPIFSTPNPPAAEAEADQGWRLRAGEDRKYSRCKKKCHGSSRHNADVMVGWVATFIFLRTRAVKIKGAQTPVKKRGGHIYHRASNPRRMKNGTKKSFGTFAEQKMG